MRWPVGNAMSACYAKTTHRFLPSPIAPCLKPCQKKKIRNSSEVRDMQPRLAQQIEDNPLPCAGLDPTVPLCAFYPAPLHPEACHLGFCSWLLLSASRLDGLQPEGCLASGAAAVCTLNTGGNITRGTRLTGGSCVGPPGLHLLQSCFVRSPSRPTYLPYLVNFVGPKVVYTYLGR